VPVALTGSEWGVLLVAIVPAVLAVVIVYFVWRWAKRSEAASAREDEARRAQNDD
jgi:membrane protein implicated in regulation of membrane protease activity